MSSLGGHLREVVAYERSDHKRSDHKRSWPVNVLESLSERKRNNSLIFKNVKTSGFQD